MMTKKHFKFLALVLNKIKGQASMDDFEDLMDFVMEFCRNENPMFNLVKFRTAVFKE